MSDLEKLLEEIKEYRAELVHKNYPIQTINEIIIKWEQKIFWEKHENSKQRSE